MTRKDLQELTKECEEKKTLELILVSQEKDKHFVKMMERVRRTIAHNKPTAGEYMNMALNLLADSTAALSMPSDVVGKLVETMLETNKEKKRKEKEND